MGSAERRVAEDLGRGLETFRNLCFEMVHFGAKVTNAVHPR